jgi:hypothetical protein
MAVDPSIQGVHLVGSIPGLNSSEDVFRTVCKALPGRLKRIPDGETGSRNYFTYFQSFAFQAAGASTADMLVDFTDNAYKGKTQELEEEQVAEAVNKLEENGFKTGYDDAAVESYATFRKLKEEGVIGKDVRFQVGLPTALSVIGPFIERAYQTKVEIFYEKALLDALERIQKEIPHQDLAIQIDLAVDTAISEGVYITPWWEPVRQGVIDRILCLFNAIDADVSAGFHFCYGLYLSRFVPTLTDGSLGDMDHKHWLEPPSLKVVTENFLMIHAGAKRSIDFVHMPVPKDRSDEAYFEPLEKLDGKLRDTEVYLGLVHYDDEEGTKERIQTASKYLREFGVATECGMGRTPVDQIDNIYQISKDVSLAFN